MLNHVTRSDGARGLGRRSACTAEGAGARFLLPNGTSRALFYFPSRKDEEVEPPQLGRIVISGCSANDRHVWSEFVPIGLSVYYVTGSRIVMLWSIPRLPITIRVPGGHDAVAVVFKLGPHVSRDRLPCGCTKDCLCLLRSLTARACDVGGVV